MKISEIKHIAKDAPEILWEGKEIIVICKPPWWLCAFGTSPKDVVPRKTKYDFPDQIVNSGMPEHLTDYLDLAFDFPLIRKCHKDPGLAANREKGLAHRLDVLTSGTMLIGKTVQAYEHLRRQIQMHAVVRQYTCLCHGHVEQDGTVDAAIYTDLEINKSFVGDPRGKPAKTTYWVQEHFSIPDKRFGINGKRQYTLLRVRIHTGRTHQIRIHMQSIGHPLVCDYKYLDRKDYQADCLMCPRLFLHASSVSFTERLGGPHLEVRSPLYKDLQKVVDDLARHMRGEPVVERRGERGPLSERTAMKWGSPLLPPPQRAAAMPTVSVEACDNAHAHARPPVSSLPSSSGESGRSAGCGAPSHPSPRPGVDGDGDILLTLTPDPGAVALLLQMGYHQDAATLALQRCDNNLEEALEMLLGQASESDEEEEMQCGGAEGYTGLYTELQPDADWTCWSLPHAKLDQRRVAQDNQESAAVEEGSRENGQGSSSSTQDASAPSSSSDRPGGGGVLSARGGVSTYETPLFHTLLQMGFPCEATASLLQKHPHVDLDQAADILLADAVEREENESIQEEES